MSAEVQELENAIVACFAVRDIDAATGATLTSIGKLVGACPRGTFNDVDYRKRIRVQILVNKSHGTAADLIAIAKAFNPAWGSTVTARHGGQADPAKRLAANPAGEVQSIGSVEIHTVPFNPPDESDQIDATEAAELARYLKSASAGGTRTILLFVSKGVSHDPVFTFADPGALDSPQRGGLGGGFGIGKFSQALQK